MILYNVTINIDKDVEDQWLTWMKTTHIPDVLSTGLFSGHRIFRLLVDDDSGGTNYSIQYFAANRAQVDRYLKDHAPRLRDEYNQRYGGKHAAFRTLLEEVL